MAQSAASVFPRKSRSRYRRRPSSTPPPPAAAPARAYIEELFPDVLEGRIEPGRVFDRAARLDDVPDGYRAMNSREAIKVLIEF